MSDNIHKILIVEDDENTAKYIQTCLSMGQYHSEICDNGYGAINLLSEQSFDLILLDVMLPGLDGFEVQERIKTKNIPIIFLTAMQDVADKVRGLKAGAEDYIVKPFEVMELLARVEVVLRRCHKVTSKLIYENIEIDTEKHIVMKNGELISVSPKEFEVLCYFVKYQDIVISRERLLSDLWDINYLGESRTVDTHVQQVRRKLELKDKLLTIPKYGYKLLRG
jgi:DNA-binding response OmpR family regulator